MDVPIDDATAAAPVTRSALQISLAMLAERPGFFDDEAISTRYALERVFESAGGSLTPLQICDLVVPSALRLRILLHPSVFSRVERSELACEFAARVLELCDNGWLRDVLLSARHWRAARRQLTALTHAQCRGERNDDRLALARDEERRTRQYLRMCQLKVLAMGVQLGLRPAELCVIRAFAAAAQAGAGPLAPGQHAAWVAAYHAASARAARSARNPGHGVFAAEMLAQLGLVRRHLLRPQSQPE